MKIVKLIIGVLFLLVTQSSFAQQKTEKKTESKNDNLMDMMSESMTGMLGTELTGTPEGESIGFLELLQKSDLPEEQKKEYAQWYYLQSKNLTKKQKDSLALSLEKKLKETKPDND